MAYEHKDNSGSLFRNQKKHTDNHPDYTGSALIDGVQMWLSAWIKRPSEAGRETFMSLSFKRKDAAAAQPKAGQDAIDDMEDKTDVPF